MNSRKQNEKPLLSLGSSCPGEGYFVSEIENEWDSNLAALQAESPFQHVFEQRALNNVTGFEKTEAFEDEFTFEEPGIINGENRVRVNGTTDVPWRWICKIWVHKNNSRRDLVGQGTGVLISDRHVLTAAHVVHVAYENMHQYTITVIPALNDLKEPFDSYVVSSKPKIPKAYRPAAEDHLDWDYALLKLSTSIGKKHFPALQGNPLCYWGSPACGANTIVTRLDPRPLNGKAVYTAGYPGGKGGLQLWCAAGILHSVNERRRTMWITADTTRGQSGSPVWTLENGKYSLAGIAVGAHLKSNSVVRVTRELIRQLRAWITEDGDTPTLIEQEDTLESAGVSQLHPAAEHSDTTAADWTSEHTSEEAEDFAGFGYEDELELLQAPPQEERFDPLAVPAVAGALGKQDWPLALKLAIQAGWRDEYELTNLVFFTRHPELPFGKLDPKGPNYKQLSAEWIKLLKNEVWRAIKLSATNTDLVVSGEEVADHHFRFFRGKSGKKLKRLVEAAALEVGLNPGLLGSIMMAETRSPQSYLSRGKVSSYFIGIDDFYEGRAAVKARVPAYAKVKWDKNQTPEEHDNDSKCCKEKARAIATGDKVLLEKFKKCCRKVKTIFFDSGPDGVLATAVYVKFGEVRLREIAVELRGDFDSLPLATRFALTRMAMAAGINGATPMLKEALEGRDIFIRQAIRVKAHQTQRNATVRTAQAMHLSDWVFGIPVPVTAQPEFETSGDGAEFGDSEFDDDEGAYADFFPMESEESLIGAGPYLESAFNEAESDGMAFDEGVSEAEMAAESRAHLSLEEVREIDTRERISENFEPFDSEVWQEQFDPTAPTRLVQLDHWHVPLIPNTVSGGFNAGSPAILLRADMNPGFVDASDALITDTTANGLQTCLSKLVQVSGARFLAAKTSSSANDRIRVAVVDMTGSKLSQPEFAGWGSTLAMYGASVPKILGLYAAFQVRSDIRRIADQGGISNGVTLEKDARAIWKAKKLPAFPDLVWLFDIRKWDSTKGPVDFTATAIATFKDISKNCPASTIIVKAGFPFIGSLTWQSGLHHAQRGGLWLNADYCGMGSWSSPVRVPSIHNVTALSVATYFTLLAQGRLVDAASSVDIKKFLARGCVTGAFLPTTIPVVASKCGVWSDFRHDCILVDDGTVRYAAVVLSRLRTQADFAAYKKVWTELDALVRKNNLSPKPAC